MWLACDVSDLAESRLPNMQYLTGTRILFSTRFPGGVVSGGRVGREEKRQRQSLPCLELEKEDGATQERKNSRSSLNNQAEGLGNQVAG